MRLGKGGGGGGGVQFPHCSTPMCSRFYWQLQSNSSLSVPVFFSSVFFFFLGTGLVASYHIPSFTQYKTGCGLNHDVCVCVT